MTISAGARLGPYEVVSPVGEGGMGDVYRARDTRLDREVALKTIKGPFTERFEREARAISSLNHPNICTLYDVGEHEGSGYLVMEYIEGKPVGGPLPVEQAVALGIQICEALDAAHKKGIVHRDLKPANILQTKAGVKLLDFGLAKLMAANGSLVLSGSGAHGPADQATVAALTGAHTVVGTPQYMAPEQIEGKEVDARTDIFAFGCVLYELLTGKRAFEGKSASTVMASVLAMTPQPIGELIPLTPPALERIVSRCLAKDPDERWQTIRDVASELRWVSQGGSKVGLPVVVAAKRRTRQWLAWGVAALATIAAAGFAVAWMRRAPEPPRVVRFELTIPDNLSAPSPPVVSPDGRSIAFAATDLEGKRLIWVRALDAVTPRALAGTDDVLRPFWSPDSKSLAFVGSGKLQRIDIAGGLPQVLCDLPRGADGSWSPEGVILVDGRSNDPIWRVPAFGGAAAPFVKGDPLKGGAAWPAFLPDGKHFLYMLSPGISDAQTVMVGSLDGGEPVKLFKTASMVQYVEPGYLLYVRDQMLVAQPFDAKSLRLEGEAVPIGQGLGVDNVGLASFSASRTGVLAFRGGELRGQRLVWLDRSGKETPFIETSGDYRDTSFSPDGKQVAYDAFPAAGRSDVWIRDVARGVTSRFTFDDAPEQVPVWSPDGRRIVYAARVKGPADLYVKDASGARDPEVLLASETQKWASDWSRDGAYLLFTEQDSVGYNIWAMPMQGEAKPFPVVKTKFNELFATFSPDGKYIAYFSDQSGKPEVYVQEFPEPSHKWQVSTEGGNEPFWRADGKELFYRAGPRVMAVPVTFAGGFSAGTPQPLFQTRFSSVVARAHYRPTPDGQRFLVLATLSRENAKPAEVVLNWTAALNKQ